MGNIIGEIKIHLNRFRGNYWLWLVVGFAEPDEEEMDDRTTERTFELIDPRDHLMEVEWGSLKGR